MLSQNDNTRLTQVMPGTPMGELLRQYWVPVMRSARVKSGGEPIRATIIGEKLVAWRAPDGSIGVMKEACPHRGASMALARNEACGLRCVYHGWLISHDGEVKEAPSHPNTRDVAKLPSSVFPAYEHGQMIWTWLGEGEPPAFRPMSFGLLPDTHVEVATSLVRCNWMNMWESLWDTFHAQFLHSRTNRVLMGGTVRGKGYFSNSQFEADHIGFDDVTMESEQTNYGMRYVNDDKAKRSVFHHVFPWFLHHAVGPNEEDDQAVQAYVPIDDDNCLLIQWMFNARHPLKPDGYASMLYGPMTNRDDFCWELPRDGAWGQNRAAMESGESFNGFPEAQALTIPYEDLAMGESQGRIDRTQENLGPTDSVLLTGRRMFLNALKQHQEGGKPLGRNEIVTALRSRMELKNIAPVE
tara:strand:+ start:996 stop:2228 length:1233 start_codon:yes stop_codon:yes gene_type:complete